MDAWLDKAVTGKGEYVTGPTISGAPAGMINE
jgi:hypothetical protein